MVGASAKVAGGREGVRVFGLGRSATAHVMATQMVRLAIEMIAGQAR